MTPIEHIDYVVSHGGNCLHQVDCDECLIRERLGHSPCLVREAEECAIDIQLDIRVRQVVRKAANAGSCKSIW